MSAFLVPDLGPRNGGDRWLASGRQPKAEVPSVSFYSYLALKVTGPGFDIK